MDNNLPLSVYICVCACRVRTTLHCVNAWMFLPPLSCLTVTALCCTATTQPLIGCIDRAEQSRSPEFYEPYHSCLHGVSQETSDCRMSLPHPSETHTALWNTHLTLSDSVSLFWSAEAEKCSWLITRSYLVHPPDQADGLAQNGWRETVMRIDGFTRYLRKMSLCVVWRRVLHITGDPGETCLKLIRRFHPARRF